jgi:hypothetical protein
MSCRSFHRCCCTILGLKDPRPWLSLWPGFGPDGRGVPEDLPTNRNVHKGKVFCTSNNQFWKPVLTSRQATRTKVQRDLKYTRSALSSNKLFNEALGLKGVKVSRTICLYNKNPLERWTLCNYLQSAFWFSADGSLRLGVQYRQDCERKRLHPRFLGSHLNEPRI